MLALFSAKGLSAYTKPRKGLFLLEVTTLPLPAGTHACDDSDFSGWDRLPWVVENDLEVEFWWRESIESANHRPWFTCSYCRDRFQARSLTTAVRWFHAHDCEPLQTAEAEAMVYGLTPMLKAAA